ncbi:hypothetical protein SDC9_134640 [bioreactor metagenome]|uniref:Lipoprotein n=1 Tax=bioreactor metagenome TaxID=1076179 RepID=A0A645DE52_9ZZZZ|nr:hypothetical protein [Proteiniphilum sp.]MEA4916751.1 hypothetical protein [Proteiniphilum sp.]
MKTKKLKLLKTLQLLLPLCMALLVAGCEKEKEKKLQYEIYENHEISACGVEDPLVNIEWLKITCDKIVLNKNHIHSSFKIDLYEENETKEHVILIPYSPDKGIFNDNVYDCSGKITVYFAGKAGEPTSVPPQYPLGLYCKYVGTLWSLTIK